MRPRGRAAPGAAPLRLAPAARAAVRAARGSLRALDAPARLLPSLLAVAVHLTLEVGGEAIDRHAQVRARLGGVERAALGEDGRLGQVTCVRRLGELELDGDVLG